MKLSGNPEFRLLQIFLGKSAEAPQVYEVYLHIPTDTYRCTCKGFALRQFCKHSVFVADQVDLQGGYIAAVMREDAEITPEVMQDPTQFRQWLYDNGRVLMLE
ncbi:MAG TPA: hypothetical protein VFI41_04610 [Gemmatimonadales bacterium]|nr:hypothetical protein [Gemmatimonadales bacterium]